MESRGIEERYASAIEASDLTMRPERGGPIDVLTAAGMAGIKHPLAMSLWRLVYGKDANARHDVAAGLIRWMKSQAVRRRWSKMASMVPVTLVVLDWYENKVCQTCHGTCYEVVPGTPSLSDVPCPACHGKGERSLDKLLAEFGGDWISRGKMLREHMDELSSLACSAMLYKTRRNIEESGL